MPFADCPDPSHPATGHPATGHRETGLTRRRFLAGVGATGVAVVGGQAAPTRVAFAARTTADAGNTVVFVFLRGGADGLGILVPNAPSLGLTFLRSVRESLVPPAAQLVPLDGGGGWALRAAMRPLHDLLWAGGELAFVPAVWAPGVTRSHFQAERFLEVGGSAGSRSGWLDRVLAELAPGETFRALAHGGREPISMEGPQPCVGMASLADFVLPGAAAARAESQAVLSALYADVAGPLGDDARTALAALGTADAIRAQTGPRNGAVYPTAGVGRALSDLASVLRAEVGLRLATVDVGGWDTHTDATRRLDQRLAEVVQALTAFMTDLGPERRSRVTVVVQTEFGRRVAMNASGGTDHGTGSLMWLLGGGVAGRAVHGAWRPLNSKADLVLGDVPGLNTMFDVLGEVVQKRLGVGSLARVFPGHPFAPLGVVRPG